MKTNACYQKKSIHYCKSYFNILHFQAHYLTPCIILFKSGVSAYRIIDAAPDNITNTIKKSKSVSMVNPAKVGKIIGIFFSDKKS